LLTAVGLPELITHSLGEYEALARELARDEPRLAAFRNRLARNRLTHPLFDIDRLRRHVESAFATMVARSRAGEPPVTFAVTAEQ
jgi:predicted O-linked N-acetylglucosamine transferase (SPINDLY family)